MVDSAMAGAVAYLNQAIIRARARTRYAKEGPVMTTTRPTHAVATTTGWRVVVAAMKAERIPYVFGLPGDPLHLYDALCEAKPDGGPRATGVRYETSGAFMAMAYARVSGGIAACFGCPGPGIANLVPSIMEAYSGCTPMLVLGVRASRQTSVSAKRSSRPTNRPTATFGPAPMPR